MPANWPLMPPAPIEEGGSRGTLSDGIELELREVFRPLGRVWKCMNRGLAERVGFEFILISKKNGGNTEEGEKL